MRWVDRLGLAVILIAAGAAQVRGSETGPEALAPASAPAATAPAVRAAAATLDDQRVVLGRTEALLQARKRVREAELRRRARAAYKLLRTGAAPPWVTGAAPLPAAAPLRGDEPGHAAFLRRLAAARRILARDVAELRVLAAELDAVAAARERLARAREDLQALTPPEPGSLLSPLASGRVRDRFGRYRHPTSRAQLTRRGVVLASQPGQDVRAVAGGVVRHAGEVRGLGYSIIIDHGDVWSVLGAVTPGGKEAGARVEQGEILGQTASDALYLEIRLGAGAGGFPVDPEPLLRWRP